MFGPNPSTRTTLGPDVMKLSNLLVEILRAWASPQSDPEYTMSLMSLLEVNTHNTIFVILGDFQSPNLMTI